MKTILEKYQEDGRVLQASCNGNQTCGLCKVKIIEEEAAITTTEKKLLSKVELEQGIRLACCHPYRKEQRIVLIEQELSIVEDLYAMKNSLNSKQFGHGIVVDIGTTTIVIKWIDLTTTNSIHTVVLKNPQVAFGGDVISRIGYDCEYPGKLHQVLIETLQQAILSYPVDSIQRMIVCGNTTMMHLFLGESVQSLGKVPFNVPKQEMQVLCSTTLFQQTPKEFPIIMLPHISAFVGSDIVAGIIANQIDQNTKTTMMIDLGTNGEIAVGNNQEITVTSAAAGPAFEGGGIQCGGPSIVGAITKVVIDDNTISYETIHQAPPICICGSGLLSVIAELVRTNKITEMGRFTGVDKKFYITPDIFISEQDIQAFQLAKAAIQAGIAILLQGHQIDAIYISGGFAARLDIEDLITLKIIPKKYRDYIHIRSNSALSGGYQTLLIKDYQRIEKITQITQNINLANHAEFEDLLIEGLYF